MIEVERNGDVATITIRRPQVRNALRAADKRAINCAVREASAAGCGAIIVTGEGSLAFCAGTDVKEMGDFSVDDFAGMLDAEKHLNDTFLTTETPIIAAVNGAALGADCVLVYCSDLAIAAASAVLGQPEVRHGVAAGLHVAMLQQVIGLSRARWLLYTGEFVSAQASLEIGLVNEVVSDEELMRPASEIAAKIAARPRRAMALQKRAVSTFIHRPLPEAVATRLDANVAEFSSGHPGRAALKSLNR